MIDLNEKLRHQTLSGLDALEYLRRLRGTSKENVPETTDPQVKLSFGRGYRVVGPTATLEELLAAPSVVDDTAYVRVPVSRREQPALVCAKDEADSFSLCWNDTINGEKIKREGTRLYALEEAVSTFMFMLDEGVDPVVVYRKRQEPIIEYEMRKIEVEVFEPPAVKTRAVELPEIEPRIPAPRKWVSNVERVEDSTEPVVEPEAEPEPIVAIEFIGQIEHECDADSTVLTELIFVRDIPEGPQEPILVSQPVKRPVGRPKAPIQLTAAQQKAAYRLKLKIDKEKAELRELQDAESEPSVLDAYPPIRKPRGGKTSGIPKNLLVKRVLEQDELCIYCDRRFGSLVLIDSKITTLNAQPDHFQPVADRRNDNPSNIYAADQICNERIKGSRKFASLEEARTVIQAAWVERGWGDVPPLMPFIRTTDPMIYGHPN